MINVAKNYFDLFGLTPSFTLDKQLLDSAYRKLQQASHPDRFVSQPTEFQRQAVQQTAQNTEAYHTLKSAVQRACYLLTISGVEFSLSDYTVSNIDLLMQQMEYREQLNEIKEQGDYDHLQSFTEKLKEMTNDTEARIAGLFEQGVGVKNIFLTPTPDLPDLEKDGATDSDDLKNTICELQFLNKLAIDLDEVEEHFLSE